LIATKQRKPPIYKHTRVAYLSDAFVKASHRKQGILRSFVEELNEWATREGITAIDVMLFKNNQVAQDIYEAMGFDPYRLVMRKELE
jgi:GNAT superfamily N-acetyltransferase